jgi:threonine dehydrogenase-like Zn-dependent dehydrogenase
VSSAGSGELRPAVATAPGDDGESRVRALFSGVSPGTERLVGLGRVPRSAASSMACRYMEGGFELPIKYGYCLVAEGVDGALAGRRVFVMHPHQDLAVVRDEHATPLPAELPPARAALIPNLETALNAVWDAELGDEERCLVVGGGAVGLLVAYVLWRSRGAPVSLVDTSPERLASAGALPWIGDTMLPGDVPDGARTVAFHATGDPAGLQTALDAVGFEGRVVDLSWYGERAVTLDLGTSFHQQRKRILASQVATIAPARRATHDHAARLREVLALLDDAALDALLGAPVPFSDMPALMAELYAGRATAPLPLVAYPAP